MTRWELKGSGHTKDLMAVPAPMGVSCAFILGDLGSRTAVVPLMELAASDSDPYIQEAAVVALECIGDSRALPLLIRLERDGSLRVRIAASRAIKTLEGVPNEN